jgi:hypothetical protein
MRLAEIGNLESVPFVGLYYNLNRTSISSKLRVQAIKKRRELVSKLGFSKVEIDSIAKVLDDIDLGYSPDADSLARKWLFLRDLYTLRNINSKAEFKLGDLRRQTRNLLFQGFDRSTSSQILYFLRRRLMRTRLKSKSRP